MDLSDKDYITILNYYNIPITTSKQKNRLAAEHILGTKLCRCIKKVKKTDKVTDPRSVGICTDSIFKKRNLKYYKFSCKKGYKLKSKRTRRKLYKTGKLKMRKTKKSR